MLESLCMGHVPEAQSNASKCILIVEDNPLNMKLFSAMLEAEGYVVLQATDGLSGIEIAQSQFPDLIIMDVNLPGMSGLEVAVQLKSDEATRNIAIVVTTAYRQRDDADIQAAGCDGFMTKPIGVSEFLETVEALVSRDGISGLKSV